MELSITYPDRVNDAGCHQNGGVALIGQMLSSCSEGGGARGHPAVMVVQSPSAALLVMLALLYRSVGFNGTLDALHMVLTKTEQYFSFNHIMWV